MGALLESGLVGNIGLKHLKVIKEDTINKWDKLGFLEGLKGHLKENVAQLYENQASFLINEATSDGSSGSFETVVFPIVRRVFSKLLANEIVSVQAMNLPIGKLFYFIPKIQGYQSGVTPNGSNDFMGGGTHYGPIGATDGGTAADGQAGVGYTGANAFKKNLYDLFYEGTEAELDPAGLFDYSKGAWSSVTVDATVVSWSNGSLVPDVSSYNAAGNVRKIILALTGFTSAGIGTGKLIGPDGNELDSETFLSDLRIFANTTAPFSGSATCSGIVGTVSTPKSLLFRLVTQQYGQGIVAGLNQRGSTTFSLDGNGGTYNNVCTTNGTVYVEVDLSCPTCPSCGDTLDGYTGTTITGLGLHDFTAVYRRYAEMEFEDKIGEVSFDLESVTVSVTERKLRAQWSPELAQDVAAFHNIDAEAELTALLSEQVAAEIDREILRDLRKGAAWNLRWDYNGWRRISATTNYTQKDWNQTLITAINQLSAQIHKSTLRGGANWIVVSSEVSAIMDDLEYFHVSNASPEQDQYNMGIERVGTLQGRYQVYRDPYFPPNQVLIGHKGTSLLDTGYIYAPYVPLQLTPTMYNPFNFTPIKGIMTRYAKKMVNNRFYARITVDGVRTFDLRELR